MAVFRVEEKTGNAPELFAGVDLPPNALCCYSPVAICCYMQTIDVLELYNRLQ